MKQVTMNSLTCEDCGKTFQSSKALRLHVAQHKWGPHRIINSPTGTKFQCLHEGCKKVVNDRKVLRKHLLTHRPRQFVCHYRDCNKRFYERAKLKRHFLVHTGEKQFLCPYENCGKQFAYKANLKTHIRTHTGHRPFACTFPGCDKRFAQASNRNSHVLTHTKRKRKGAALDSDPTGKARLKTTAMNTVMHAAGASQPSNLGQAGIAVKQATIMPNSNPEAVSLLMLGQNKQPMIAGNMIPQYGFLQTQPQPNFVQYVQAPSVMNAAISYAWPPSAQYFTPATGAIPNNAKIPPNFVYGVPQGSNTQTLPLQQTGQSSSSVSPQVFPHKPQMNDNRNTNTEKR